MTRHLSLVTGGSGFLGSALVKDLLAAGHRVRVLDDHSRGRGSRLEGLNIELMVGDLRDRAVVRRAVAGVDTVWHLGAVNGTKNFYERPDVVLEVGVEGTLYTVQESLAAGVSRYVLASSSEVYHQPSIIPTPETVPLIIPDIHNPRYSYAGSKIAGELLAINIGKHRGLDVVIIRPHNVYGPDMGDDHVIPELGRRLQSLTANGETSVTLPIEGDGSETRAFCYVSDASKGIVLAGLNAESGAIVHVGRQEEISIADLVRQIGLQMGIEVTIEPSPRRAGGTMRRCPDVSALRALGWEPTVSLQEGLAASLEWYLS